MALKHRKNPRVVFFVFIFTVIPIPAKLPRKLRAGTQNKKVWTMTILRQRGSFQVPVVGCWGISYITKKRINTHLEEVQPRCSVLAPTIRHVLFVVQLTVFKHRYHCTYIRLQGCRRRTRWYVDVCMLRYT